MVLRGRVIKFGRVEGEALVSYEPINFLGGVDPETGVVVERGHPLEGECIAGKVLVFPTGKGSTVGSYTLYRLAKKGLAPSAIINSEADPVVAVGAIIAEIPMVDKIDISKIETGKKISVEGEVVEIGSKMGVLIKNLHVELGDFLLKGIDLDVEKGEYFVVLGPTGAGKTILLETIAGLHQPLKGEIWLDGEEITSIPPEKRGIGFVYQDYALFPHLSVADNIAFGLKIGGMSSIERERRVKEIAELLGIEHLLWRKPMNLSGGEKQRVALARALVISPRLLLLDEPLSAIDPAMREGLQRELLLLHQELNVTTLHVTHDFEEAVALADRIAIMNEGLIVQIGKPYEVFRQPKTKFVALFVGARNVFEGSVRGKEDGVTKVEIEGLEIETLTELTGRVHVSLRPEDILISTRPLRSSARNSFKGEVARILDKGPTVYVMVRVPPDFVCLITKRSFEEMGLREGVQVYITFKASAVHVF